MRCVFADFKSYWKFYTRLKSLKEEGYGSAEGLPMVGAPQQARAHLQQNLEFAQQDIENGIPHSLELHGAVHDGFLDKGGERTYAFATVAQTDEDGGLVSADGWDPENGAVEENAGVEAEASAPAPAAAAKG